MAYKPTDERKNNVMLELEKCELLCANCHKWVHMVEVE